MKRKREYPDHPRATVKETSSLTVAHIRIATCAALMIFAFAGNSSAAPCRYTVPGDLNNDCKVNLLDLSIMAGYWLSDCE